MIQSKLILSKRVLSNDESLTLINGSNVLPNASIPAMVKLDKSIDSSLFEIMTDAAKACSPLKLATTSISAMYLAAYTAEQLISQKSTWTTDSLEFKSQMFVPLNTNRSTTLCVSLGSSEECLVLEDGFAYFWPAMASFCLSTDTSDYLFFITGKTIGKKLN